MDDHKRYARLTLLLLFSASPILPRPARADSEPSAPAAGKPVNLILNVSIADGGLVMVDSLPRGSALFHVRNEGTEPHALAIQGPGVNLWLTDRMKPRERNTKAVKLSPGRYYVSCPLPGHAEKGEFRYLTVFAPQG